MFSKLLPLHAIRAGNLLNSARTVQCHQLQRLYSSSPAGSDQKAGNVTKIYYGSLTPRMKAVKVFSITTSLTGMAAQPIIMEQGSKLGGAPMMYFLCGVVGFFTFVTPVLLHVITKKYVTEITYDESTEEYTATTISFFLTKIQTKFRLGDIKVPEVPGMFSTFMVKDKTPLFVDVSQFTDPEHYVRMMGYDKPLDLKMNPVEESLTQETKKEKHSS